MNMLEQAVDGIAFTIGVVGLLIIVYGTAVCLAGVLRVEVQAWHDPNVEPRRRALRHELGYYLILGLEFLVAADIIHTIVQPSMDELIRLGVIVIIRTVLNVSLNWELERTAAAAAEGS